MSSSILIHSQQNSETLKKIQCEISTLQGQIELLKAARFDKENKIEDLKALIVRVSAERTILRPIKFHHSANSSLSLNKLINVASKNVRKYSEDTHYSELSKGSTSTTTSGIHHDSYRHNLTQPESNLLSAENNEHLNDNLHHFALIFNFWSNNLQ